MLIGFCRQWSAFLQDKSVQTSSSLALASLADLPVILFCRKPRGFPSIDSIIPEFCEQGPY